MTTPLAYLAEVKTRDELVQCWLICVAISKLFPEDGHWVQVVEAFKARAQELGIGWRQ